MAPLDLYGPQAFLFFVMRDMGALLTAISRHFDICPAAIPPAREFGWTLWQPSELRSRMAGGFAVPEGVGEDFEEECGYDQEQQEKERLHARPPWERD